MKTIVLLSGGMDSCAALACETKTQKHEDIALLSFDYGQRHRLRELDAAIAIAAHYGLTERHFIRDIELPKVGSLTGDEEVPEGHYESETMKSTVVPLRNIVMLAYAGSIANANGYDRLVIAAHSGDHAIYPDCRGDTLGAMARTLFYGTERVLMLSAPFINQSKANIVTAGASVGAPFHLTWSCYKGGEKHCGKCGTCVERREAFTEAGLQDPTEYQD
jgi:7-cyano-7-deazaguanine synthase